VVEGVEIARPQKAPRVDALSLRTFYVVRHGKAGNPDKWTGDDRLRPLNKKGKKQAEELVALFKRLPVSDVYSSDYLRCVQTVEPLAAARHIEIKRAPSLEFGSGLRGLGEFLEDRALADVVLSTHGDIVFELVEDLVAREVIKAGEGGDQKGSTWVLEVDEHGVTERARFIPAP
jgi:phosphohistidine phosphatase SixA